MICLSLHNNSVTISSQIFKVDTMININHIYSAEESCTIIIQILEILVVCAYFLFEVTPFIIFFIINSQAIIQMYKSQRINSILISSKQLLESNNQYSFVRDSLTFLKSFMNIEDFGKLYVSFNGGKDATVVLFLTLIAMQGSPVEQHIIKCIYFSQPNPFEEVDNFIAQIQNQISLDWISLPSKKYAQQLSTLADSRQVKYIIMGSRKTDPWCEQLTMKNRSDMHKGYPDFQRLNPIIYWSEQQVWKFLIDFHIPYCSLYDQGYTSLGNKDNTIKNKQLWDQTAHKFKPAFYGGSVHDRNSRN